MKQIFLLMLSASLVFTSCSKNDDPLPEEPVCPVQTVQYSETYDGETSTSDIETVGYDSEGRITSFGDKRYTYQNNLITEKEDSDIVTYTLDANGKVTGAVTNDGITITTKYNSEGYLSEFKQTASYGTTTSTLTYTNGKISKINEVQSYLVNGSAGISTRVTNITYKEEISNNAFTFSTIFPTLADIANGNYTFLYLKGLGNTNRLLNTVEVTTTGIYGDRHDVEVFNYEKDASGNITKVSTVYDDGATTQYEFTYKCN